VGFDVSNTIAKVASEPEFHHAFFFPLFNPGLLWEVSIREKTLFRIL
jgi:hypothetical protein